MAIISNWFPAVSLKFDDAHKLCPDGKIKPSSILADAKLLNPTTDADGVVAVAAISRHKNLSVPFEINSLIIPAVLAAIVPADVTWILSIRVPVAAASTTLKIFVPSVPEPSRAVFAAPVPVIVTAPILGVSENCAVTAIFFFFI
jgi:hypothetical protein